MFRRQELLTNCLAHFVILTTVLQNSGRYCTKWKLLRLKTYSSCRSCASKTVRTVRKNVTVSWDFNIRTQGPLTLREPPYSNSFWTLGSNCIFVLLYILSESLEPSIFNKQKSDFGNLINKIIFCAHIF